MYEVKAYTKHHAYFTFTGRDIEHAREIANRIITEGLWVDRGPYEEFYPITEIFKVKVTHNGRQES